MRFALKSGQTARQGIVKLFDNEVEAVLRALHSRQRSEQVVHEVRRHCKKARAVARLVRGEWGDKRYRQINACLRDAAKPLTGVRDADVLVHTLDHLLGEFGDGAHRDEFIQLRHALLARRRIIHRRWHGQKGPRIQVSNRVERTRKLLHRAKIPHKGWLVIGPGLATVYGQGRQACLRAAKSPSIEALHEWRKQAKYLRYELELMEPLWDAVMTSMVDELHHLTDLLGEHHDLAVLSQKLSGDLALTGNRRTRQKLLAFIARRLEQVEINARRLGARVYGEGVREFSRRIHAYWRVWRTET